MKAMSKLLVAGMLAMGTALPVAQAHTSVSVSIRMTISDALAYRILEGVAGQLEAQLNQSLSTDFLYNEYKNGRVVITHLGNDGVGDVFEVAYSDGVGQILLEGMG